MPRRLATLTTALVMLVAVPVAADEPTAVTTISDVRGSRLTSGGAGLVGYTATHSFNAPISPPAPLPGQRIDRAAHPAAFEGTTGDYAMLSAWLAPNDMIQFSPNSGLYESAYYTSSMPEKSVFGDTVGVPVDAGDRFELGVVNVPNDSALDWSSPRQASPPGTLAWDVATDTRHLTARKGGGEGEVDVVFFRADIVARGGDVDARGRGVDAPPLVIDLPKTYPGQALGGYFYSLQWPHTHYVGSGLLRVFPSAGKAVFRAGVNGYLPQAHEVTLPNGRSVKEWHLTITGVISVTEEDNPAALEARTAYVPTGPARAVVGDLAGNQRTVRLGAADTLVAGPGLDLGTVIRAGANGADSSMEGGPVGPGMKSPSQELRAAAQVTSASLDEPRELTFGRGAYTVTLDHDFRGTGTLALRDVTRMATGHEYVEAMGVPYVRVDGQAIKLGRDRLVDIRVSPFYRWIGIAQTGWGASHERPTSFARTSRNAAHRPGMAIDAVYDVGGGRYAFVTFEGFPEQEPPSVAARTSIRTLTGQAVAGAPIQYLELPDNGPVTHAGEEHATEFSAPLDLLGEHPALSVGMRDVTATISTAGTDGIVTVVRGGGPPVAEPVAGSGSITEAPLGLYYAPPPGADARFASSFVRVTLAREPAPEGDPKPLGAPCGTPQVSEAVPDAPPPLDIREAWLDADAANLYATFRIADLPTISPDGVEYSYAFHWRTEHSAYFTRAVLTGSTWSFWHGFNNQDPLIPGYSRVLTAGGEVKTGPNGLVRVAVPVEWIEGDVLRDTSARANVASGAAMHSVDVAPNGAGWQHGTGGDYRFGFCG